MWLFVLVFAAFASMCAKHTPVTEVTIENINDFIGGTRPVFLRMVFSGGGSAAESQKSWEIAADIFSQVSFIEFDCLKGGTSSRELCSRYQIAAKCQNGANTAPSHVIFRPGESDPVVDTCVIGTFGPGETEPFLNAISETLKIGHIEHLKMLVPDSIETFVMSKRYTAMVLYNSNCQEDTTFVGRWATDISQDLAPVPFEDSDIAFGRLDCSQFPEECASDSDLVPCVVFHEVLNEFSLAQVVSTSSENISSVIAKAKVDLAGLTSFPLVAAISKAPAKPTPESDAGYAIMHSNLETRTIESVKELFKNYKSEFDGSSWTGDMTSLDQCVPGESVREDREQALVNLNILRTLAGVGEVTLRDQYFPACQQTALVLHKLGYATSDPDISRADICVGDQASVVTEYAKGSVLVENAGDLTSSIGVAIADYGKESLNSVGRRRWLLNPHLEEIGFGFVPEQGYPSGSEGITEGRPSIVVIYSKGLPDRSYNNDFVSWPSAGPFPVEHVPRVWHVSSRIFRDSLVSRNVIKVRVTREDETEIPVKSFFLNREWKGTPDALILQMDDRVLELCTPGHEIRVEIWVTNKHLKIDYRFTVFDMKTEVNLCLYASDAEVCKDYDAEHKFDDQSYGRIPQIIAASQSQRAVILVGEKITGPIQFSEPINYRITGEAIKGDVVIGSQAVVDMGDASHSKVVVEWDVGSNRAGQLITPGKAQHLNIRPINIPTGWTGTYSRVDVYKGQLVPPVYVDESEIKSYEDGYLFFGNYLNGSTTGASVSYVKDRLIIKTGDCSSWTSEEISGAYQISDIKTEGLGKNLAKKKHVTWYVCDSSGFEIDKSIFPDDAYTEYEIVFAAPATATTSFSFTYDPVMEKTIKSISFAKHEGSGNLAFTMSTADGTYVIRHRGIRVLLGSEVTSNNVWIPYVLEDKSGQFSTELTTEKCVPEGEKSEALCKYVYASRSELWFRCQTDATVVESRLMERFGASVVRTNQFFPKSGTEGNQVTLKAIAEIMSYDLEQVQGLQQLPYFHAKYGLSGPLVIENYQDIALQVNPEGISAVTYINVGNVKLDFEDQWSYDEISVTEPGAWSSYLSSVRGITITNMTVTCDTNINAEKAEAKNLFTASASCRIFGLKVTENWELTDSIVTLASTTVESALKVKRKDRAPRIIIEDDTTSFDPISIEYDMGYTTSSAQLLGIVTEYTTLISGIKTSTCESIKGRVTIVNADGCEVMCEADGSLVVSRRYDTGTVRDIGDAPGPYPPMPVPPAISIDENQTWSYASDVPSHIKIATNESVALQVEGGIEFSLLRADIGSQSNVVATNMLLTQELTMTGGSRLSASKDSRIMIVDGQTNVSFFIEDGKVPSVDFGSIGYFSPAPSVFLVDVRSPITGSYGLVKGRTLNCRTWLRALEVDGPFKQAVSFRCERTAKGALRSLLSLLDEWEIIADENKEGEEGESGGLPHHVTTGLLVGIMVVVGLAVGVGVYCFRRHNRANRVRLESSRITASIDTASRI